MITARNLSKSFGTIKAVSDLSFSIGKGEVVGFLGPNGAGKTTTMRIVTGFLAPDSGEVEIDGVNILKNPLEAQRKIGYLPEGNPLYPQMLVSEILNFFADLREIQGAKRQEAFDFAVSSTGVAGIYNRPFGELSKGLKQRVGLAQALLHQPEILIMDEPTEGLDPNQRAEIRKLILNLGSERTVLLSTHVLQEVMPVCNRIMIINKGSKIADGSKDEVLHRSQEKNKLVLTVEGKNVVAELEKVKEIKSIENVKEQENKVSLTLTVEPGKSLQPQLMRLAFKNKWIVWEIGTPPENLEEIFFELTQGK